MKNKVAFLRKAKHKIKDHKLKAEQAACDAIEVSPQFLQVQFVQRFMIGAEMTPFLQMIFFRPRGTTTEF